MLRVSLLVLTAVLAAGCSHKEADSEDSSYDSGSGGFGSASSGDHGSLGSDTLAALKSTSDDSIETASLNGGVAGGDLPPSPVGSSSLSGGGKAASSMASSVSSAPMSAVSAAKAAAPAVPAPVTKVASRAAPATAAAAAASGGGDLGFGSQDLSVDLGAYARKVTNPPGQHVFPRTDTGIDIVQACLKYRGPDLAQIAFVKAGGPGKDPLGLDPDGDGYACGWDPTPFR
ncbi:hypothetical protein [Paenirhodobacter enshiensis]|uniref:hypothetical protein n=1 Tax=Paenirhodobacter enshiensis TaxID=1105367 RepID=UPI0035AE94F1